MFFDGQRIRHKRTGEIRIVDRVFSTYWSNCYTDRSKYFVQRIDEMNDFVVDINTIINEDVTI